MPDHEDVLSLNLTQGCVQRCAFCSVRAHPAYQGDEVVTLYTDTAERLEAELSGRRKLPRAVYISPSTDPFPPVGAVQAQTARVIEVLARHRVEAWLLTRGWIRPSVHAVLAAHRDQVRITVGVTTLDRALQRLLEPLAAPPRLRLRQIASLIASGVRLQVALEPLVPGLTDTRANLEVVLEALAQAGVHHVSAGYLFLRSGIRTQLLKALEPHGWGALVCDAYTGGPILSAGSIAPAQYLPRARRQRGYAALMALAAGYGITVSVCSATNPDFTGQPHRMEHKASQPSLFRGSGLPISPTGRLRSALA
jgi:DNA repair photolyase